MGTALNASLEEMSLITGQKPKLAKATNSVSGFKVREGMIVGLYVTLRRARMYAFLEKLIHIVFPRTAGFRGLGRSGFDGSGNYTIGISDQESFPELDYDYGAVVIINGVLITIVTTAKTNDDAHVLLGEFSFPFIKKK